MPPRWPFPVLALCGAFAVACSSPGASAPDGGAPACGDHGYLVSDPGGDRCSCDPGYTGATCTSCAPGFADRTGSGTCTWVVATCADDLTHTYCGHGTCDAAALPPVCRCEAGYTGTRCGSCATGYKAGDSPGTCIPIVTVDDCGGCGPGWCDTTSLTCICPGNVGGEHCDGCAAGYVPNATDGTCVPGCALGHYACDGHGACVDGATGPTCDCEAGYAPAGTARCVPASGLSCADPQVVDFAAGYAESTTLGGSATLPTACGIATEAVGRVLRVSVPAAGRARFRVAGASSLWLSVQRGCAAPDLGCVQYASIDTPLELDVTAGDYFVFVQGWQPFPGDFALSVEMVCPAGQVFVAGTGACVPDPCASDLCTAASQHVCRVNADGTGRCDCDPGYSMAGGACVPSAGADGASCAAALVLPVGGDPAEVDVAVPALTRAPVSTCNSNANADGGVAHLGFFLPQRSRVRFYATAPTASIAVSVRRDCVRLTSEVMCQRDGSHFGLGDGPAVVGGVLPAGAYTLVVDGIAAGETVHLAYDARPDPCAAQAACDGGAQPQPAADWSSCACACPEGQVAAAGGCVPDPCASAPCTGPASRCMPDDAGFHCECPLGAVDDGGGGCAPDPDAAEWTVIVYQSLDNNLGVGFPAPTSPVGAADPIHMAWLAATPGDDATLYHAGHGSGLAAVEHWSHPDMGDWRTLRAFVTLAAARYPAHHYALVIQDHGGGFEFGWDTGSGDTFISVLDRGYARALAPLVQLIGQPLDIVDFETCLMANWEVAQATRPFARSLLGSPEVAYGMDGGRLGRLLAQDPQRSLADLGHAAVDGVTSNAESWIDLEALGTVTARLSALADDLRAHPELCAVGDGLRAGTWNYAQGESDLGAFAAGLAASAAVPQSVRDEAAALGAAIGAAVYTSPPTGSGLTIYLPPLVLPATASAADRALDASYTSSGATWVDDSTWDELLVTCRQR